MLARSGAAVLSAWLLAAPAPTAELGDQEPPSPEGAGVSGFELSTELGAEMSGELDKVNADNLETAASRADEELAKTYRFVWQLTSGLSQQFLALNRSADGFLPPKGRLREDLDDAVQRLTAKETALKEKASAMGLSRGAQEAAISKVAFRPHSRASDLRRAERDAASARKRLRIRDLPPGSKALAEALDSYVSELDRAARTVRAIASAAPPVRREELSEKARAVWTDLKYLEREAKLLRAYLILRRADRQLTGRPAE